MGPDEGERPTAGKEVRKHTSGSRDLCSSFSSTPIPFIPAHSLQPSCLWRPLEVAAGSEKRDSWQRALKGEVKKSQ